MRDKAGPWNAGRSALSSAGPFGRRGQMTARDRQAWVIASSLFASLFLLWGSGYNTFPIFFPALLKYFGWSKAQMALISSGLSLSLGISAPFAGWDARPDRGAVGDGRGRRPGGGRSRHGEPRGYIWATAR